MKALILLLTLSGLIPAQAADNVQLDIGGTLISPACRPQFSSPMEIKMGDANINQLKQDTVPVTEVPLVFNCRAGSQVTMVATAGAGSFDNVTLLTNRAELGLRLVGNDAAPALALGQPGEWTAGDVPLVVKLRLKPVALQALPDPGAFSATLLMQISYL
ncbi:fimbrial protein [Pseudomonas coleopterorum]|uniref:fimbrial protein n=1 Tax=Pseudomonas coleopterorum TaxID=1605838 RepID=UPI00177EDDC4|nr:fimbrial protein [Pseudomonas coleopterorum]MBD8482744.1 fimbrial protein [Pseudomonas coleopterorum]